MSKAIYRDAFNLLCGEKIGEGIHRKVFECRIRPELVVKVEQDIVFRFFANAAESVFWGTVMDTAVSRWLAPCEVLSPDGRLLLQRRVVPLAPDDVLPATLPGFLTDIKRSNFGWLPDTDPTKPRRLVCVDYAYAPFATAPSMRMKSVKWD